MPNVDLSSEGVLAVVSATRAAGDVIREVRRKGFVVDEKGGGDPVTEADLKADSLLRERLPQIIPAGWLSEETADTQDRLSLDRIWIVDPLDGTKEFVEGVPQYVVAVALVEDGRPVLGVVHNPESSETFWAVAGKGALRNGDPIAVRESSTIAASRSETRRGEFDSFDSGWQIESIGSIQYKLALVAAGKAAVTLSRGPKHEWDVAAGALVVAEAGGIVTDAYGEPFRFNNAFPKVAGIVAGAPDAYGRVMLEISKLGMSDRMRELEHHDERSQPPQT